MTTRRKAIQVINDFSGGQNSANPPDTLALNEAVQVQNLIVLPNGRGIRTTEGDSVFNSSAMNSGATVTGLLYYKQADGDAWLVATAGNKIFKSDSLDGTMDDITGGLTVSAGDNNIWTSFVAQDVAVFVGGAPNAPFKWTGTGNAAALGGSPPSGNFGFYHNNRCFIGNTTANPSRISWSVLGDIEDWSGDGSGFQDVQTNDGDTLVGYAIINTDLVLLFKQNSIHQLVTHSAPFPLFKLFDIGAAGKNAIVRAQNGLVYFITSKGRMRITDGERVLGDETFPKIKNIDDVWDGFNKARLNQIRGIEYRGKDFNWIIWSVCNASATQNNYAVYWDIDNRCWGTLPNGYRSNIFARTQAGTLYGGHFDGKIYQKDVSGIYTVASEAGIDLDSVWRSGWYHFGDLRALKYQEELLISAERETSGKLNVSVGRDYLMDTVNRSILLSGEGGIWDQDKWDQMVWGGDADFTSYPILTNIRGRVIQYKFDNIDQALKFTLNSYTPVGSVSD